MQVSTPARDFLLPRLEQLVQEAIASGIARDVAVAVLIDLVTGPGFNDVALDPRADDPGIERDQGGMTAHEVAVAEAEGQRAEPSVGTGRMRRLTDPSAP